MDIDLHPIEVEPVAKGYRVTVLRVPLTFVLLPDELTALAREIAKHMEVA
jgi:hypothetical protein